MTHTTTPDMVGSMLTVLAVIDKLGSGDPQAALELMGGVTQHEMMVGSLWVQLLLVHLLAEESDTGESELIAAIRSDLIAAAADNPGQLAG